MCPSTMKLIPGGLFWVGSPQGRSAEEEHPRFQIRIQAFCLDETEVTASKYDACVSTEKCTASRSKRITCTSGKENRADHPMNCIDWHQAKAYCEVHGARLPSEVEWEYAASGGSDTQRYSWGNETPEGRTCWKLHRTCPVGSFAAGDFGLRDMTGNVWNGLRMPLAHTHGWRPLPRRGCIEAAAGVDVSTSGCTIGFATVSVPTVTVHISDFAARCRIPNKRARARSRVAAAREM